MTYYTRALDGVPGATIRSATQVEAEFDLVAAGFASVATDIKRSYRAITTTDTAIASDRGKLLSCSGTFTLSFTAAATLGDGWFCIVRNTGTGNITLDPNSTETIDGLTTGIVYPGFAFLVVCTGSVFHAQKLAGFRREVLTSGTSWTCPLGIRRVRVGAQGGGASGGRSNTTSRGGGGGGGGYAELDFASVPGTSYTYSIGGGGAARTVDNTTGANGSDTTWNTGAVTVTGGGGVGGVAAGGGGAAGGTASNGDINIPGGFGANGLSASAATLSFGGGSRLGVGGYGYSAPQAATGYGAGGAGSATGVNSGAGTDGAIVLEY